jgi:hypothetical protein
MFRRCGRLPRPGPALVWMSERSSLILVFGGGSLTGFSFHDLSKHVLRLL